MLKKARYGIDAPYIVLWLLGMGITIFGLRVAAACSVSWAVWLMDYSFWWISYPSAFCYASCGILMLMSSLYGKMRQRDFLLEQIAWHGDEQVLDVGCGKGLLLIGAAKKLTSGRAVGIDLWRGADLSGNAKAAVLQNARDEGVEQKIAIVDGDVRAMPFASASFDVIVSSFVIHNISAKEGRAQALREIARVLKPSGKILIQDFQYVDEYAQILQSLGLQKVHVSRRFWGMFPPARIASALAPERYS